MVLHKFEEIVDYPAPSVTLTTDGISIQVQTTGGKYLIRTMNGDIRFEDDDTSRPLIKEFLKFADRMQKKYKQMWEPPKIILTPQKKNRRKK